MRVSCKVLLMAKRKRTRKTGDTDHRFTVRLAPQLREALAALAKDEGRPLGNYVRRLLEEHIKAQPQPAAPTLAAVA